MFFFLALFGAILGGAEALRYAEDQIHWNLNQQQDAIHPVDYWGEWKNHTFHPSPTNWRFPFYALTIDRYVDGDPTNNLANGTTFEHDWMSNQFRFGGDTVGLMNNLDYIQGMGIKAIYLSGSPFINMPWSSDGFGPLDLTLLDHHHGQIKDWRNLVNEIHHRGMYLILDNTMATMGDLLAFKPHANETAPFNWHEYDVEYKTDRQYLDFTFSNEVNTSCEYPRMWNKFGHPMKNPHIQDGSTCRDSEFDQYGDAAGVGAVPIYVSQLGKFSGVQDRLRAWRQDVLDKLKNFSCMQIAMLDIDGFRIDKAAQTPLDAHSEWSEHQRECARRYGKENFLIVGEVVGEIPFSELYVGRGKQPEMAWDDKKSAMEAKNTDQLDNYIFGAGKSTLDGDAFHYPIYGAMTRFLGLDGPIGLEGIDFVSFWHEMITHSDFVNTNTGEFDPRHLFGMTNQDVFRWPGLQHGTDRHLLGLFIMWLQMPGAPFHLWGEEQEFYVLENQASDYVFGRTPMSSSRAWQLHGCYKLGEEVYVDMPFDKALRGCEDDSVSLDHRNPAHPLRNVVKRIYELRRQYPVLNDGFHLQTLSTHTHDIYLPGSLGMPSPTGLFSVYRGRVEGLQDFSEEQGNQGIWMVYSNENHTVEYEFDCSDEDALIAAFPAGTTVKNLFFPYEEHVLHSSNQTLHIEGSETPNGCLPRLKMGLYDYKAFVPIDRWARPGPTVTYVSPSHDQRLLSTGSSGDKMVVPFEVRFSTEMNCQSVVESFSIRSTTNDGSVPHLKNETIFCQVASADPPRHAGEIGSEWILKADLENVAEGVHIFTIKNPTTENGVLSTGATDHFMFRVGQPDNPIVFPATANYTSGLLHQDADSEQLYVTHKAPGADKWQYSLDFGTTWSDWRNYVAEDRSNIKEQPWSGTSAQAWEGHHIMIRYWSKLAGSVEHIQHGDLDFDQVRRWPQMHLTGPWNMYGYDSGLDDSFTLGDDGTWTFDFMTEFPTQVILNTWGIDPDGNPDKSKTYGDVNRDGILDWLPPNSLGKNVINATAPDLPYLGNTLVLDDSDNRYYWQPVGSANRQIAIFMILAFVPVATGLLAIFVFIKCYYQIRFNETGNIEKNPSTPMAKQTLLVPTEDDHRLSRWNSHSSGDPTINDGLSTTRRSVLVATMEYVIKDWDVKVKIGGLGQMAVLMAGNLKHQDLFWVVPCVSGIEYPVDEEAEPMRVVVDGKPYKVSVQYHQTGNVKWILLDCPIFRKQTSAEPYPPRMDDLDSAIYYSAWNQCIAEAARRFNPDIYHVNDYHGALAPLYLLPETVPCCLSLHNAEFQGSWSLKTPAEYDEMCRVFNLSPHVVDRYVRQGEVFNLLGASANYLKIHQRGFGAVGVSNKYGKRSYARYPVFWGLHTVAALPNPDPDDIAAWNQRLPTKHEAKVDNDAEAKRLELRVQAQEWAGLHKDPTAELFVFIGRWVEQKGVDLIADAFPSILEKNPKAQLICVGPVVDLYGKLAAIKLERMVQMYPGRVHSTPKFTRIPDFVRQGAEFALIPSRDEPFGLVAVELGRQGALGIGAAVGGLGQMPGWWYKIESRSTKHLLGQFKDTINQGLRSSKDQRAILRARSTLQRFPVAEWLQGLETLERESIRIHEKVNDPSKKKYNWRTPFSSIPNTAFNTGTNTRVPSGVSTPYRRDTPPLPTKDIPEALHRAFSKPQNQRPPQAARLSINTSTVSTPAKPQNLSPQDEIHSLDFYAGAASVKSGTSGSSSVSPSKARADQIATPPRATLSYRASIWSRMIPSVPESPASPASSVSSISNALSDRSNSSGTNCGQELFDQGPDLDLHHVLDDSKRYNLQQVEPFFNDTRGEYTADFKRKLEGLNPKNSEGSLCIEDFLVKSKKHWFNRLHNARLGIHEKDKHSQVTVREVESAVTSKRNSRELQMDEFGLPDDYKAPTGVRKLVQRKIRDWPVYTFLLALGQIIAANSYQITLLTGEVGQTAEKLYIVAAIYFMGSCIWWMVYRRFQAVHVVSLPFFIYGSAFFVLGMAPYAMSVDSRGWVQNIATGLYAFASASGSLYFALNFGSENGVATEITAFRACAIQGVQTLYVTALWYWGSYLTSLSAHGATSSVTSSWIATAICVPIAALLAVIGTLLYLGLPQFYRAAPGHVPSFYAGTLRRKIVAWFFVVVVLQNLFLSAPYGRNWRYLWSSHHAPAWAIALLVVFFFVGVWAGLFAALARLSLTHSWVLPLFAIGLGAPRWAQMLWGVSGLGAWVPWAGSPLAGALLGRALWLWLGVLDAAQGVGFGMILLQTLTRFHMAFALTAAQALGSVATIVARAAAPDRTGPGDVFPNLALSLDGLAKPWFWGVLACQLLVCGGFLAFFRREQLFKP